MSATAQDVQYSTDRARLEAEAAGTTTIPDTADPQARSTPISPAEQAADNQHREQQMRQGVHKTPADEARDAIAAKFASRRGEIDESGEAMLAGARAMTAEAAGAPEPVPPATTPATRPNNSPASTVANGNEVVTIRVDGQERAVPLTDVYQHGIRTLQKEATADARLARVTEAERSFLALATAERARLDARAAEIERSRPTTPTGAGQPTGTDPNLPTGDEAILQGSKKALDALLDGDTEGGAKVLAQVVTSQVDARVKQLQAQAQPAAPAPAPRPTTPAAPWSQREIEEANALFVEQFHDVAYTPEVFARAQERIVAEMADPINRISHANLDRLVLRVGREFVNAPRQVAPAPQPQPPATPNSVPDELAARRALAARVPGMPPSSAVRVVNPAPSGPAPQTRSQAVAAMRKARGQQDL